MTTWATFKTIAETSNIEHGSEEGSWGFRDWEGKAREGQAVACDGSMRKCVEWMGARVLYGA